MKHFFTASWPGKPVKNNNPHEYLGHETLWKKGGSGTLGYSRPGVFRDVIHVPPMSNITVSPTNPFLRSWCCDCSLCTAYCVMTWCVICSASKVIRFAGFCIEDTRFSHCQLAVFLYVHQMLPIPIDPSVFTNLQLINWICYIKRNFFFSLRASFL